MLGYAWQQGRVPLTHASLMRAIELNGVQVDNNKAAFEWGRRCAHDLAAVQALFKARAGDRVREEALARRDGGQARRVPHRLPERAPTRRSTRPSSTRCARPRRRWAEAHALSEAVARYLFKLMAYKDEYEVARLHTDPAFTDEDRRHVRRRLQARAPPGAAADREEERQGRAGQAAVRPVDAQRLRRAGAAEGPARHGASTSSAAPRSARPSAR